MSILLANKKHFPKALLGTKDLKYPITSMQVGQPGLKAELGRAKGQWEAGRALCIPSTKYQALIRSRKVLCQESLDLGKDPN